MITLTPEDRLALKRACETRIQRLTKRIERKGIARRGALAADERALVDERARVDGLRRLLATGGHLVLP